ncbi:MAG: MATE family efflux transporter [Erysipelotrichaceae bacterium]|nr:MATE family efflux transporter [Erysipelotrichaceae bacterium]
MAKRRLVNLTNGKIIPSIIQYGIPIFLANFFQLIFNAVCVMLTGKYSGKTALAAIGATNSLIQLLISIPNGMANGTNVLVYRYNGANDRRNSREVVTTALMFSIISGTILAFCGIFSRQLLSWVNCPEDTLSEASMYMRIYCAGMPFIMLHTYASIIIRSYGDTKRPLYFAIIAGIVRVIVNLIFVVKMQMGVAGVALSYIIAFAVNAALCVLSLSGYDGMFRFNLKSMKLSFEKLKEMFKFGLPAGIQSVAFCFPNVKISAGYNSFGSTVLAAHTAKGNVEGYVITAASGISSTALSFVSANAGAGQYKRLKKILINTVLLAIGIDIVVCNLVLLIKKPLLSLYTDDAEVLELAMYYLTIALRLYFPERYMTTLSNALIALGHSNIAMIDTMLSAFVFRLIYLKLLFEPAPRVELLLLIYPISWTINCVLHTIFLLPLIKKGIAEEEKRETENNNN